jgi:hypothetical protein
MGQELKIIQDFYDLMIWTINHTSKFPRHHRHSLGVEIEKRMQDILAWLIRARYTRKRASLLDEINVELEVLRFQFRMAKDLKLLPLKSHEYAAKGMIEIGRQLGGWKRQAAKNGETT